MSAYVCVRVSRRTGEREEWRGWRNAVSKSTHKTALISEPWRGPGTYHSCQQSHSLAKTHRSAVLNQVLSTLPSNHESPNRNHSVNKKVPTLLCCPKAPLHDGTNSQWTYSDELVCHLHTDLSFFWPSLFDEGWRGRREKHDYHSLTEINP